MRDTRRSPVDLAVAVPERQIRSAGTGREPCSCTRGYRDACELVGCGLCGNGV